MEKVMYTSEAAGLLGLGVSTLRNYAVVMESKGYYFDRGANNGRVFKGEDLDEIRAMMEETATQGITVEEAAQRAAERNPQGRKAVRQEDADVESLCNLIADLKRQQMEMMKANAALEKQVRRLAEKVEDRERDSRLFERVADMRDRRKKGMTLLRPFSYFTERPTSM